MAIPDIYEDKGQVEMLLEQLFTEYCVKQARCYTVGLTNGNQIYIYIYIYHVNTIESGTKNIFKKNMLYFTQFYDYPSTIAAKIVNT